MRVVVVVVPPPPPPLERVEEDGELLQYHQCPYQEQERTRGETDMTMAPDPSSSWREKVTRQFPRRVP